MSAERLRRAAGRLRSAGVDRADELHVLLALVAADQFSLPTAAIHQRAGATADAIEESLAALDEHGVVSVRGDRVTLLDLSCLRAVEQVALAVARGDVADLGALFEEAPPT